MHFIISRLINFINTTSIHDMNYNIAKYLLTHITEASNMTIYDVAEACFVSPASVSRFVKTLGYTSFSLLKNDCLEYAQMRDVVTHYPDFSNGLDYYIDHTYQSLKHLLNQFNEEQIHTLVKMIDTYEHICLLGIQFSQSIAMQMQSFLLSVGKMVEAPLNIEKQMERIEHYKKGDMVILFSARGNYGEAYLNKLLEIKKNGCSIIVMTQTKQSHLCGLADMVIETGISEDIMYSNYNMYMMMSYISYQYIEYHQSNNR